MRPLFFLTLTAFTFISARPALGQWRHFGQSEWQPPGFIGIGASAPVNPLATRLNNAGWNISGGFGVTQGYAGVTVDALFISFGINDGTLQRQGARSGYDRF